MADTLKVVLIGESGVGKTSIIGQFNYDNFCFDTLATTGPNFYKKIIELKEINQAINLEFWDMPGVPRMRILSKDVYKDADVIILCYDSTRKNTFEELKYYWYEEEIKINVVHDPILIIVANKNDLNYINKVKDEEGKAFAEEINAIFQSTSAMSNYGIISLFENIVRKYLILF